MKILFIAPFLDGTGYAHGGIDYALAMDAGGLDVVCRALKLNDAKPEVPARIHELLNKTSSGCEVNVQYCLPHQMVYDGNFRKNIALFASETTNFSRSNWADHLNLMSEVWVINQQQVEAARQSGVTRPIHVVKHPIDIDKFQGREAFTPHTSLQPAKANGTFLFYTIGEFVRRKNFAALIRAFHTEFCPSDNVGLVLKTNVPGLSPEDGRKTIEAFCAEIKQGLKLGPVENFQKEVILTDRMSEKEILQLHYSCDCFVSPSCGEAFSIPAAEAMAAGKTPIVTGWGGFLGYMQEDTGWLLNYSLAPVFGANDSFADLYTGVEEWAAVDVRHLQRCMREAYENPILRKQKALAGIRRAYAFDYNTIGQIMRRVLIDGEAAKDLRDKR